jgi:hypothetical protein
MVIYKTTNTITKKWYIGKDANNRGYYLGSGKALTNAIKKYGKDSFEKTILEECNSLEQLSLREKYWITVTNAVMDPMSYNLAPGGEGGDLSKHINYSKIDYSNYTMSATKAWFNSLSEADKKEFHAKQGETRSKIWYVSRIDDSTEIQVKNISAWCKENQIDTSYPSKITNPNNKMFQGQHKGWRFRKEGQDCLPVYVPTKRGSPFGTLNKYKGQSWKMVDSKRVWVPKEINN